MALPAERNRLTVGGGRQVFDLVVLGAQLPGLLAAGLLLKRGYRVLVADPDTTARGYESGGYQLPLAPFALPSLKALPLLEAALSELGLLQAVQRAVEPFAPDLQLLLPRHRLDLPAQPAARAAELRREFPEVADAQERDLRFAATQREKTDGFFATEEHLPPDGFLQRWGIGRRIRTQPALSDFAALSGQDPVSAALRAWAPFLHHGAAPGAPLPLSRVLGQYLEGTLRYPGGREGLGELLLQRIEELGAVVISAPPGKPLLESVTFDGAKLSGLQLARGEAVTAACGLVAMDAAALARWVPEHRRQAKLLAQLRDARPRELLFTINLVLPAAALPVGLGQLALLQPREPHTGPVLLQVLPARGTVDRPAPADARCVTACCFVPGDALERGSAFLERCRDALLASLADVLPFAAEQALLRSVPLLELGRPAAFGHAAVDGRALLGVAGLPPRSAADNLLFCNRQLLPGLGLEGELLAAYRTVRLVQKTVKKRDPLKG